MSALMTNEIINMTEIEKQFDGEWVLLDDVEVNQHLDVTGGRLLFHSKSRDEVDAVMLQLRPKHSACLYIGAMSGEFMLNL